MMLDKLIIHLKNIIFFKSVVYFILIALLISTIPRFQNDLLRSNHNKIKAKNFLANSQVALKSIVSFEKEILETNIEYKKLVQDDGRSGCIERENFLKNLKNLETKYKLPEPINLELSKLFTKNDIVRNRNAQVKMHEYQVTINFDTDSYEQALELSNDIWKILPDGSIITNTRFNKINVLTPYIINKLSVKTNPGLINVVIQIILRDIVYEE